MLAAAFIRVVGSEFVQKYLGEGPRMVRDVFRLAKENAPAIIFIDEIDAIATKRFDAQTGGEQRPALINSKHSLQFSSSLPNGLEPSRIEYINSGLLTGLFQQQMILATLFCDTKESIISYFLSI